MTTNKGDNMDSDNEKALLAEVANIINDSAESLDELPSDKLKYFIRIEQAMHDSFGFHDNGHLFQMVMVANNVQEVQDYKEHNPEAQMIRFAEDTDETNRAMRIHEVGEGDMLDMLADKYSALSFANDDNNVGIVVRFGAFATKMDGVKPSEATDKQSCVMTILATQDKYWSCMRTENDPDNPATVEHKWSDYTDGEQKLLDGIKRYYHFPNMLKHTDNKMFNAVLADYKALNDNKHKPNNEGEQQ